MSRVVINYTRALVAEGLEYNWHGNRNTKVCRTVALHDENICIRLHNIGVLLTTSLLFPRSRSLEASGECPLIHTPVHEWNNNNAYSIENNATTLQQQQQSKTPRGTEQISGHLLVSDGPMSRNPATTLMMLMHHNAVRVDDDTVDTVKMQYFGC